MNGNYIGSLLDQQKRFDGRKLDAFRSITLETGISKNAEGSARCKIGDTEVIAGVKMDTGVPYPDSPDQGSIIVTVELSPLASPDFELGPPGEWATELARIVDRGIRESKAIDLKSTKLVKYEDDKVQYGEFTNKSLKLDKQPITVTLYKMGKQIFVDPTHKEEQFIDARL